MLACETALQGLVAAVASLAAQADVHRDAVAVLDCGRQEPTTHFWFSSSFGKLRSLHLTWMWLL